MPRKAGLLGAAVAAAAEQRAFKTRPELLLLPNVPKPLHTLAPRVVLGQDWWNRERRAAYASTGFRCAACGRHKMAFHRDHPYLEGHEVYDIDYLRGRAVYVETVPLCWWCHAFIHDGRLEIMAAKGEITKKEQVEVMRHGRAVLRAAGRRKVRRRIPGKMADWKDWRLVVYGKEYGPAFKSYAEWKSHFGSGDLE